MLYKNVHAIDSNSRAKVICELKKAAVFVGKNENKLLILGEKEKKE